MNDHKTELINFLKDIFKDTELLDEQYDIIVDKMEAEHKNRELCWKMDYIVLKAKEILWRLRKFDLRKQEEILEEITKQIEKLKTQ